VNRKLGLFIAVIAFLFLIFGVDLPDYLLFVRSMKITKEKLEELSRNYEIYLKKLREYEEALNRVKEKEELTLPAGISISENGNTLNLSGTMLGKDLESFIRYVFGRKDIAIKKITIINEKGLPICIEGAIVPTTGPIKFTMILEKVR